MRNNQDNNKITLTDLLGKDTLILKKINVGESYTGLATFCDLTLTLNESDSTDLYDSIKGKTAKECQKLIQLKSLTENQINIIFDNKSFAFTISGVSKISELSVYTFNDNVKHTINFTSNTFSDEKLKNGLLEKLTETIDQKMQVVQKISSREQEEQQKEQQEPAAQQRLQQEQLLQQKEEQKQQQIKNSKLEIESLQKEPENVMSQSTVQRDVTSITLADLLGGDNLMLTRINVGKSRTSDLDIFCDLTLTLNGPDFTDLYDSIKGKTAEECQKLIQLKSLTENQINIIFDNKSFAFTISGVSKTSELSVYTFNNNVEQGLSYKKNTFSDKQLEDGLLKKLTETIDQKMQVVQKISSRKQEEQQKEQQEAAAQQQIKNNKVEIEQFKNEAVIGELEKQKETENQQKLVKEENTIKLLQEKDLLQKAYEGVEQAFEDFKNGLSSFFSVSAVNTLEEKDKLTQVGQEQLEEAKRNDELQERLKQEKQKIIQMKQEHSEKLKEEGEKFQTQEQLNENLKAQIAEIKNKGSNGNIDALFDENKELKTLYHTASEFEKIGQANLDFQKDGKYDTKYYESFLKIKDDNQDKETKDSEKFDLLRKSIIQSSAIRDKHSILQEVLQEKGLMTDGLREYKFKSLDQLIDGDNFKDEFKADLKNLGFGEGENGIWAKGEGYSAVTYDTNQPYVKDFLINAYYEENFKQFQETLKSSLTKDGTPTLDELEKSAVERYNAKQKLEFVEQVSDYQKFKEDQKQNLELKPNNNAVLIENIIDWNSYSSVNLMGTAVTDYETRFNAEKRIEENDNSQDNRKICVNSKSSLLGSEYIIPEDKSYVGYFDKGVKSFAEETLKETESVVKALEKFITTENVGGSKIPGEKGTDNGKGTDSGRN